MAGELLAGVAGDADTSIGLRRRSVGRKGRAQGGVGGKERRENIALLAEKEHRGRKVFKRGWSSMTGRDSIPAARRRGRGRGEL